MVSAVRARKRSGHEYSTRGSEGTGRGAALVSCRLGPRPHATTRTELPAPPSRDARRTHGERDPGRAGRARRGRAAAPEPGIRSQAESTALNVVAILRETWEDFRNADRYFKFKAAILGAWAVLAWRASSWPARARRR